MENLRKIINFKLVNNAKDYKKYISKPSFVSQKIFRKDFATIHLTKLVLKLDKPVYVGLSIVDLSKILMCDFYQNYIKIKYDNCAKLLIQDTNSLTYEIETEDVYEDFYADKNLFILITIRSTQSFMILST